MKNLNKLLLVLFFAISGLSYGQIRIVNSISNSVAPSSSAFIDASSNSSNNGTTNIGKGLIYPRVNLTTFAAFSGTPAGIPSSYPGRFDGMVVYNTATGTAGIGSTNVNPGFYYYSNPSGTNVNGGKWVRMNDGNITSTPNGTVFPTVPLPNAGDVFYRTDLQDYFYYNGASWIGASNNWKPNYAYVEGNLVQYNGNFYIANSSFTSDATTFGNDAANWNIAGGKDSQYSIAELLMDNQLLSKVAIAGSTVDPEDVNNTIVSIGYLNGSTGKVTNFSGSLTGDVSGTQGATEIGAGKVTNSMLAGSIASSKLVGSDITTVGTLTSGSVPYTLLSGTVPTWNQNTTGNAATATFAVTAATATNLSGGLAGQIPYQTASGTTAMLAAGTSGQVLTSNGAASPTWTNMSGGPLNVTAVQTGNYTALATDDIILYTAYNPSLVLTLPTIGVEIGKKLYISNNGTQIIDLSPLPRETGTPNILGAQCSILMYIGGTGDGSWSLLTGY